MKARHQNSFSADYDGPSGRVLTESETAKEMLCEKCGAIVPADQLVCDCFQTAVDQELEQKGVAWLRAGHSIWLTRAGHLLPHANARLTLCHAMRYKVLPRGTKDFSLHRMKTIDEDPKSLANAHLCAKCLEALKQALAAVPATDAPSTHSALAE